VARGQDAGPAGHHDFVRHVLEELPQSAAQLSPPPAIPSREGSSSQCPRRTQGPLSREASDEVMRLLAPARPRPPARRGVAGRVGQVPGSGTVCASAPHRWRPRPDPVRLVGGARLRAAVTPGSHRSCSHVCLPSANGSARGSWFFDVSPRAKYVPRMLPPGATAAFVREHDAAVRACPSRGSLRPPLEPSRTAPRASPHAIWCSQSTHGSRCHPRRLRGVLCMGGLLANRWSTGAAGGRKSCDFLRGWQHRSTPASDKWALEMHVPHTDTASRALLLTQATVFQLAAACRCWSLRARALSADALIRPTRRPCGVFASRTLPLERAVARVCQEARARVAHNVRLAAMNIDLPVCDDRHIEVVANGLSMRHGSQQAVDATFVSPVKRQERPSLAQTCIPVELLHATRPTRARACSSLLLGGGRRRACSPDMPDHVPQTHKLPCERLHVRLG